MQKKIRCRTGKQKKKEMNEPKEKTFTTENKRKKEQKNEGTESMFC